MSMRAHTPLGAWITPALIGFVIGTALQLQQPRLGSWTVYAGAITLALALAGIAAATRDSALRVPATLVCTASLAFGLCGARALQIDSQALAAELEGRDLTVSGVVAAMPQRSDTGSRFRFDVESAALEGEAVQLPPGLYLGWYGNGNAGGTVPDLRAGERWRMNVRLKAPHGNVNPHGFDYELWLWEQQLQATGYVRAGPRDLPPQRITQSWLHPVELARQSVRDAVLRQVEDRKTAGILAALIVGDQNAIERGDWDIFRATGVAHLMSISGLHITMFAWAARLLGGAAWRRSERLCLAFPAPHAAVVGGVALAWAYALFSGWGVPAQRTILMLATLGALRLAGRRWPWPQVWLLACAVVVAVDPWAMLQAGFWLSFVAVGVLFAADPGPRDQQDLTRAQQLLAGLRAGLHEQWVVTLALTPLTVLLFGQVSVVGFPANALAISLGHACGDAAGVGRRGVQWLLDFGGDGGTGIAGLARMVGVAAACDHLDARGATVGRSRGSRGRAVAGDPSALVRETAGRSFALAGIDVAGAASARGRVRIAGGRRRPRQRLDRTHFRPHAGL